MQILAGATLALFGVAYRILSKRIAKTAADQAKTAHDQKCMHDGTQALLRNEIIKSYNEYISREYMPIYARENVQSMYDAYHGLGGNGTITHLVVELNAIPSCPKGE